MSRRIVLVAVLAAALPLLAADSLEVKPGLWETRFETSTPGTGRASGSSVPSGASQNMNAGMRELMDQMGSRTAQQGPLVRVTQRSCVTAEQLQSDVFRPAFERRTLQCDFELISATPRRQEIQMTCAGEPKSIGHMVIDVADDSNVHGTMTIKSAQADTRMKFKSRWLGAACDEGAGG